MKPRLRLLVLTAAVLALAAGAGAGAADRFDRTKSRIDALLGRRLHPPALPEKVPNPFNFVNPGPVVDTSRGALFEVAPEPRSTPKADPAGVPLTGDEDVLNFFAAQLKINGQLQVGGVPLLIINGTPYKEGDLVQVHAKDGVTYFLRIVKISPNDLTLSYNEAVRVIPIRN